MDIPPSRLSDWLPVELLAAVPDTVMAALVSAVVTLGLVSRLPGRHRHQPAAGGSPPIVAGSCDFLIEGEILRPLNDLARQMASGFASRDRTLPELLGQLAADCCRVDAEVEALVRDGISFHRHCTRNDGTAFEVLGRPEGRKLILTIRPASAEARERAGMKAALEQCRHENGFLREALDRAPLLAWTITADNRLVWANTPCRERFALSEDPVSAAHHMDNVLGQVPGSVAFAAPGDGTGRKRVKMAMPETEEPRWFDVSTQTTDAGETLFFALPADEIVAAEASLSRFVETLTETFAHLPIGLAIFDRNRRLGLFNPALADLVKIDPAWLARRPNLRDFLEKLRETRQMPEQKNFIAFRRMLTELEEGARDGTYEENWVLPSGRIFRVTGRPHPQGALAFLFEDISPAIHLERRFRAELELSQATLDSLSEAVAVFDTSGMLVFVNAAFENLWGFDPMEELVGPGIGEVTSHWESRCVPSGIWGDLCAFATAADERTGWSGAVMTLDGRPLRVAVAPLPAGATLVTFREPAAPAGPEETDKAAAATRRTAALRPSTMPELAQARSQGL